MRSEDTAFVVRVQKRSHQRVSPLDTRPTTEAAGFEARSHWSWADTSTRVRLDVWSSAETAPGPSGPAPTTSDIALLVGQRSESDGRIDFGGMTADRPEHSGDGRQGVYASVALAADGTGAVWNDPLGFRCLYSHETADEFIVGTRAALVAAAGGSVSKDVAHAAWLAWLAHWVGESTGFDSVRMLSPGETVSIHAPQVHIRRRDLPWTDLDVLRDTPLDELCDVALDDLTTTMRALAASAERPILRLTGGRDSRVLLGVAIAAGIERDFDYVTIGPPHLLDVIVASELAEQFGLEHRVEFMEHYDDTPFAIRSAAFARATAGMVNVFDTRPTSTSDDLIITGVCGELLRASEYVAGGLDDRVAAEHHFRKDRFNSLGLVAPDVFDHLHDEFVEAIFSAPDAAGLDPLDLVQRHCVVERMRLVRLGPATELPATRMVQPLNSPRAARVAMALGGRRRQAGVLAAELLRRTCPGLVDHRFAGPVWDDTVRQHLVSSGHKPRESPPPSTPATSRQGPDSAASAPPAPEVVAAIKTSLVQHVSRGGERVDFLRASFGDRSSRAWDVLDRDAALAALDRYDTLRGGERKCLFGVATAIAWLD